MAHLFCHRRKQQPKVPLVISEPTMFRRVEPAHVSSISEVMGMQLPGGLPPKLDLNNLVERPVKKEPIEARSPLPKNNEMNLPPSPKNLRSVFSSPELRGEPAMVHDLPPLRAVRSKQSDTGGSRRKSWFSVKTEIIEGQRTAVRKVLDTMGCTRGERFDIHDFQRVKPASALQVFRTVHQTHDSHARRPQASRVSFIWNAPPVPKIVVTSDI